MRTISRDGEIGSSMLRDRSDRRRTGPGEKDVEAVRQSSTFPLGIESHDLLFVPDMGFFESH